MVKVCVTGHRPQKLGGFDVSNPTRTWVRNALSEVLDTVKPNYAYSGMALGVDQDFADLCVEKGIPFEAVIPFPEQPSNWNNESQTRYYELLKKAKGQQVVCSSGYAAWKMQRRNEAMVDAIGDDGIVVAVWDGSAGGTANCFRYAAGAGKVIVRIDPKKEEIMGLQEAMNHLSRLRHQ